MLNHVVVALEGAESHATAPPCALDCAAELGARTGAEVVVLHVAPHEWSELETLTPYQFEGVVEATEEDLKHRLAVTHDSLRGLQHRVQERWPVQVDPQVAQGPVRPTMERLVRVRHGDLLMARFGEAPCKGGYLAALPERVLRELDVPTLFLASGTCGILRGLERVLVPLDGTAYAEAMLPLARDLLPAESGALHLLLILPARPWSRVVRQLRGLPATRAAAEAYLDRVAARPELEGVHVERTLLEGVEPAAAIDRVAREAHANLVAMMTRDRGPLGRAVLGSITHRLLQGLRVPLLVWRSPGLARQVRPAAASS